MRLGAPIFRDQDEPDRWVAELKRLGYSGAFCPVGPEADKDRIEAFAAAAKAADIVIAEVGTWSSPVCDDEKVRRPALEKCRQGLALADAIGARCCVNVSGGRGTPWFAPDAKNLTEETFDLVVETVRGIIDAVKPTRTFYTLETMQWMYPHTVDSYLRLIAAIDRKQFAVHMDPVNLLWSPERLYTNAAVIRDAFAKLGPHIKSCHAKDVVISKELASIHMDEIRPGLGLLDYGAYLAELGKSDPDMPLMIEHLKTEEEFTLAADHIRSVADEIGVRIR